MGVQQPTGGAVPTTPQPRPRKLRICREGWPFVLAPLVLGVVVALLTSWIWALPLIGFGLFSAFFFRDPDRAIPADPSLVVSPADGKVIDVQSTDEGLHVAIFLSVFNVHVNRAPMAGTVRETKVISGKFLAAFDPRVAELNERVVIDWNTERGSMRVIQIAGLIARRIICRVGPDDRLAKGERFGLIRFGSRTDVILPPGATPQVKAGDRVRGGSTVIASWEGS